MSKRRSGPDSGLSRDEEHTLQQISQQLPQGQEQPPALLDQAIRNAARRAHESQKDTNSRAAGWWRGHWLPAASGALVMVLALGIGLQLRTDLPTAPPPPHDSATGDSAQRDAVQRDLTAEDSIQTAKQEALETGSRRSRISETDSSAPAPDLMPPQTTSTDRTAVMESVAEEEAMARERLQSETPAPAAATTESRMVTRDDLSPIDDDRDDEGAPLADTASTVEGLADDETRSGLQESERNAVFAEPSEDPQQWLDHITRLQRAGQQAEAASAYQRFRARYPDFPLPEDFQPPTDTPAVSEPQE